MSIALYKLNSYISAIDVGLGKVEYDEINNYIRRSKQLLIIKNE